MGWVMLFASVSVMYTIAEIEKRNGIVWAIITLLLCLTSVEFFPKLPLVNVGIGFIVSFMVMFILKIVTPKGKVRIIKSGEIQTTADTQTDPTSKRKMDSASKQDNKRAILVKQQTSMEAKKDIVQSKKR